MKKGKVLITVTNNVVYDRRVNRIATTLAHAGYEVHCVGRLMNVKEEVHPAAGITRIKSPFRQGPWFYFWFNIQLYFFARKFGHDIHVSVDTDTLLAGIGMAFLGRKKLVYDSHEWFERTPELLHSPIKRWIWRRLARRGAQQASLRMTVSYTLAQALEKSYGAPFQVVRNLPMYHASGPGGTFASKTIVYLGVLNAGRGLEIAIDALLELPGYQLKLIGEGDLSAALRSQVHARGLEDRVHLAGQVLPEQISGELVGASFGLLLLDPASDSYRLSLANKFFDYVQNGVPLLCSSLPEYRNLMACHPVGLLLESYTVDALVSAIKIIEQDTARYLEMVDACRVAATEWCWEAEAPKLLKLFEGIKE